jgi:hypothetical protein
MIETSEWCQARLSIVHLDHQVKARVTSVSWYNRVKFQRAQRYSVTLSVAFALLSIRAHWNRLMQLTLEICCFSKSNKWVTEKRSQLVLLKIAGFAVVLTVA